MDYYNVSIQLHMYVVHLHLYYVFLEEIVTCLATFFVQQYSMVMVSVFVIIELNSRVRRLTTLTYWVG